MSAVTDIGTLIVHSPGIHGGRPVIAGTGVTVQRIAVWHRHGYTPEEIARKIDHLSLAQIHAAIAYYYANSEAIESDIAEEDEAYQTLMREHYAGRQNRP